MKGHMEDGKFHPHTQYKGVRKSRDQQAKTEGIKIDSRKKREKHDEQMMAPQIKGMSEAKRKEWEDAVGSEVVKVKKEMINGKPVTSVRFANGEEWFEFDDVKHQEDYIKKEKIEVDESIVEEFVEIDHPDIAGYITMATGKILFGEKESRKSRDGSTDTLPTQGRANVKLHTSNRGERGTQFNLEIGDQLSDIGVFNLSATGIDRVERMIADVSIAQTINSKDDMFKFSRELTSIIQEMIEDGDLK